MLTYSIVGSIIFGIIAQTSKNKSGIIWGLLYIVLSMIFYFLFYFSATDMLLEGETTIGVVYFAASFLTMIACVILLMISRDGPKKPTRFDKANQYIEIADRENFKKNYEVAFDNYQNALFELDKISKEGGAFHKQEARKIIVKIEPQIDELKTRMS